MFISILKHFGGLVLKVLKRLCSVRSFLVPVLLLLFFSHSYTFEKIQEGSDRVWKFQRYNLIREYHDRPTLVPPLMIFSHMLMFLKWIIQICGCGKRPVYGSALSKCVAIRYDDFNVSNFST